MKNKAKETPKKREPEVELVLATRDDELVKRFKAEYKEKGNIDLLYQVPYLSQLAHQYQDKDGWSSLLRAHALYNSCSVRDPENRERWLEKAYQVQLKYWQKDLQTFPEHLKVTQALKCELEEIRARGKRQSDRIAEYFKGLNCDVEKLSCPANQELYVRILQDVPRLSHSVNQDMINFTKSVVEKSLGICGSPFVEYCVVALGSMARGEMSPYSDLEFLFLVESMSDATLQYFERLAVTMYFFVGNLCETRLKVMAIPELLGWDDDKEKLFHWFDDTCMSGFKIDGLGSWAGNIPTGGTPKQSNQFICTVEKLAERYKFVLDNPDSDSESGDLTAMLANTAYIIGDKHLYNSFLTQISSYQSNEQRDDSNMRMLVNDAKKFDFRPNMDLTHTRQLKSDIYRYPSILILNLKILCHIESCNPWQIIDLLEERAILSAPIAVCLRFSFCCALFIRLSAYFYHGSQNDNISVLSSKQDENLNKGAWYMRSEVLVHMFIHLVPLKAAVSISQMANNHRQQISVKITTHSIYATVGLVKYYCGEFDSVLSLFRVVHPKGVRFADDFTQKMYIHSAINCDENAEAESLLKIRIQSGLPDYNDYYLLGRLYQNQNLFSKALDSYQFKLAILSSLQDFADAVSPEIAQCHCDIGLVLLNQEKYSEALVECNKCLGMYTGIYGGKDHIDTADILRVIGSILEKQNKQRDALERFHACLAMMLRIFGDRDHVKIADVLCDIGNILKHQGKYAEALVEYRKCLSMRQRIYGSGNHPQIAEVFHCIGVVLRAQNQYAGALESYQNSLDIYIGIHRGVDHVEIAEILCNIGVVLDDQRKYAAALDSYRKSLDMFLRIYGDSDKVVIAELLCNIGTVLCNQEKNHEALVEYEKCLDMRLRMYGNIDHVQIADVYFNTGIILRKQRKYEEALGVYERCMQMRLNLFGNVDHCQIADVYYNIGMVLWDQGNHMEAFIMYKKCLDMRQRLYEGRDHIQIADVLCNIGIALRNQRRYEEALEHYEKCLDIYMRLFGGRDHPQIADVLCNMGAVLRGQSKNKEALDVYNRCLDMYRRAYGNEDHVHIASVQCNIGGVLACQGQYAEALLEFHKSLDMFVKFYGDVDHPTIQTVKQAIARLESLV